MSSLLSGTPFYHEPVELIGRRFGPIRITDVIGEGGMGDVYAGYDENLARKVAIKVLHAQDRLDAESRERLLREARALSKLDHPNICRIHDYILSDEVDLLVLEYIDGRTVQDAVIGQQLARAEKLRIAIAVAEVFVATHRVGIIHRDLKPENVMLTRDGEVKVLDFGLARWLNVMSTGTRLSLAVPREALTATTPLQAAPRRRQAMQTEAGVTMGTPIYMSPEQARGEELTTASDMYAFGLFLQVLFTGSDPHPLGLSAREVILRAARGETVPVSGVSHDVATLINRLKQFAPADRPTAIETVARLRFLADKTNRIVRRFAIAAAVVLVLFGAWRYTVDLNRERANALRARAEADRRRAQAEDLIEFMLSDLGGKLDAVGGLEILDDAAARAVRYIDSLKPETMSAAELTRNAKALNQLAGLRVRQKKNTEARALFGRSLRFAGEAVKREPRNAEAQTVLAQTRAAMAGLSSQ